MCLSWGCLQLPPDTLVASVTMTKQSSMYWQFSSSIKFRCNPFASKVCTKVIAIVYKASSIWGSCAWLTRQWLNMRKTLTPQDQVSQDSGIRTDEGWGQNVFWEKTASPGSEKAVSTFFRKANFEIQKMMVDVKLSFGKNCRAYFLELRAKPTFRFKWKYWWWGQIFFTSFVI